VNVPERSWNIGFDYELPVGGGARWGFHADWVHDDEIANDLGNTPELMQPETDFFNAAISYRSASNWQVIFGGRNLGDERHVVTGQNQPAAGLVNGTYNRPREWFATVRIDFEERLARRRLPFRGRPTYTGAPMEALPGLDPGGLRAG